MNIGSKIKLFLQKPFHNKINSLHIVWRRIVGRVYYRQVFASFGSGSILYKPLLLSHPELIHVGKNVLIRQGARLEAVILDSANPPKLYIEDNVHLEQDCHIVFVGNVTLRNGCGLAPRCTLNCGAKEFFDIKSPVKISDRTIGLGSFIEIGEGSVIGAGCVIQMNVRIGKHVVVGSNSAVKKNIPDYSVADGNPAAVVMRYDETKQAWVRVRMG